MNYFDRYKANYGKLQFYSISGEQKQNFRIFDIGILVII